MNKSNSYSVRAQLGSQTVAPRAIPVYAPSRVEARERVRKQAALRQGKFIPRWLVFVVMVMLTFMVCVTLNVKSFSQLNEAQNKQNQFRAEIEQLKNSNSALAEELTRLHSDPATIERAARERLSMVRANEKVLVSAE